MNLTFNGSSVGLMVFATFWSFIVMLFWMYVAWRAMRAHERLAAASEAIAGEYPVRKMRPLPRVSDGPIRNE